MREPEFRMRYGAPAVLAGWFIAFIVFCFGLTIVPRIVTGEDGGSFLLYLFFYLFFGFPVAAIIALPLAILAAWPLRRLRNQWLHVLILAMAMGVAAAAILFALSYPALVEGDSSPVPILLMAAGVALCTAIGRASVMKLVSRRNSSSNGVESQTSAAKSFHQNP